MFAVLDSIYPILGISVRVTQGNVRGWIGFCERVKSLSLKENNDRSIVIVRVHQDKCLSFLVVIS